MLFKHPVPELGPLVDEHVAWWTEVVGHAGVDVHQEVLGHLDVRSLISASSGLWREGAVTVQTIGNINTDLGVVKHVSIRHVGVNIGPRGWDQDVDGPDVGPAT